VTPAVSSSRFPYLRVVIEIGTPQRIEQTLDVEALVDTGFDGSVMLPPRTIDPSIRPDTRLDWTLADGSSIRTPAYLATVRIGALAPVVTVVIALGDEPLLGREVTDRFRLIFDHGQRIVVEP